MSNFSLTPTTAAQIAQRDPVLSQNKEPGFANTYGPGTNTPPGQLGFAVPALGMSALGLYLLYQKYQQDKRDQEEKIASVDREAIRAQLPGLHIPDTLIGGAAGAGAGMLYDYIRGGEKGKRFLPALRRILTGAALGAGVTNFAGDRFRRYLTNSVVPAGYDAGNILEQLKPRSWQHVYDAAIRDVPSYDPAKLEKFVSTARNTEVGQRILAARREIERIGQGVNTHNPDSSVWQRNTDKTYSLNEKNKDYLKNLSSIFLPSTLHPLAFYSAQELNRDKHPTGVDISGIFKNPNAGLRFVNSLPLAGQQNVDFFGTNPLLGAQQLITRENAGRELEGLVLDRHDVTPSTSGLSTLYAAFAGRKMLDPKWRDATINDGYEKGQTNSQVVGGTLGRLFWDRILRSENPWVTQKFKFIPAQDIGSGPENNLQLLKQDNTPATAPLSRDNLHVYLKQLQSSNSVPALQ